MERTSSLVVSTGAPAVAAAQPLSQLDLADTPTAAASVARYVASGQRIRDVMDLVFKVCVGLVVLVALAWALGVLPGAVKLF